ncbi:MAG: sigma-54 dependent transcriptional regulator [Ignavibacteria bacterium]|nr:sigma-54 dependent transcriptional regulator [Ignavibacteria bacterium]
MFENEHIRILLIEDEDFDVNRIQRTLEPFSDRMKIIKIFSDGSQAVNYIKDAQDEIDVIIMDFQISGGLMGEDLIREIKNVNRTLQIIVITKMTINLTDYTFANALLRAGAFWYCTKYPGDIDNFIYQPTDFVIGVFNAYQKKKLEMENVKSNEKIEKNVNDILRQNRIIGESLSIKKLKEDIIKCAESDIAILIRGSSGTGKELVAYNIHYRSKRKFENFIPINCGGIPNDLIESELFGYEKGAFTGADKRKPGLFELANNGTIFLDEVTELGLNAQVKLLRVIQDGELEKLGRTEKVKVNVRIISATNKNIEEEVNAKRFRQDLYYRLNVVSLLVPDLKERKSDIQLLLKYFLSIYSLDMNRAVPQLSEDAMDTLINHSWQGNVRELKNVTQRIIFSGEKIITREVAFQSLGILNYQQNEGSMGVPFPNYSEIMTLKDFEKNARAKYFEYVRSHSNSDTEAAQKLGLAPPNFHRMRRELGIK